MQLLNSIFQSGEIKSTHQQDCKEADSSEAQLQDFADSIQNILSQGRSQNYCSDYISDQILKLVSDNPIFAAQMQLPENFTKIKIDLVQPWMKNHSLDTMLESKNLSEDIATHAEQVANDLHSYGKCFVGVKKILRQSGIDLEGASAYMAKEQLQNDARFIVANVPLDQFNKLPRGSIVVWDRSAQKPDGHISVALGNGKEASDHIQNQIMNGVKYGGYTVFIPK